MEKQKAQMRVEERDRRAEELKNQMMNAVPEVEEIQEDKLPFENTGIEEIPKEETPEEPEVVEEPEIVEEENSEEKKEKKADKQTTLFSF